MKPEDMREDASAPDADAVSGIPADEAAGSEGKRPEESERGPAGEDSMREPPRKRRHPVLITLAVLFLAAAAAGLWAWNDARTFLASPPENPGRSVIVDVEPGSTLSRVADMLKKEGVVTDALRFKLLARWKDRGRTVQAGRFLVSTGWTPEKVLEMLVTGKAMLYRLTLREGLTWWETAALLEKGGFCRAVDFGSVIHDPSFLRRWGIPFASAEGFLFPETYLLPHPRELDMEAARSVAGRLVDMFWRQAGKLWQEGRPAADDLRRLVTLASIVEKETGVPAERARVAGVYANRLQKGMLLQADPTVIYGMGRAFSGPLLRKHLEDSANPYNTYRHAGLPPGPICSFGMPALRAAVSPEAHEYLYFVATGRDAGHTFSRTLEEHNRAVRGYREALREKGARR